VTALPLSNSLAKVRKLLPVRIVEHKLKFIRDITIVDKNGAAFCWVPNGPDAQAVAKLIRDAMNQMKKDEA
jgi:hypothetical protein